jgi:plasmid maintenance system antidote protein VapI
MMFIRVLSINDIVREARAVTPDTALRVARFFNTTVEHYGRITVSVFVDRLPRGE